MEELDSGILDLIKMGDVDDPSRDEAEFDRLALEVFRHQFAGCSVYAWYCEDQGVAPGEVDHWSRIPPLPVEAFSEATVATFPVHEAITIHETSGTSTLGKRPGRVYRDAASTRLRKAATRRAYQEWMLPDRDDVCFVSLVPAPEAWPNSGIAECMATLMDTFGTASSSNVCKGGAVDEETLQDCLREAVRSETPVALHGASFTFVDFLYRWRASGTSFELPKGSRINHGSGYKARGRVVGPGEFRSICEEVLGLPGSHVVDTVGMTELGSQFYAPVLRATCRGRREFDPGTKHALPWARTIVIDPLTGSRQPAGVQGELVHFDLAQRGNALAVQTGDLGVEVPGGFEIWGRLPGAEERGCNLRLP